MKHHSNLYAAAKSPVIEHVQWTVSAGHADVWSSPDDCDFMQRAIRMAPVLVSIDRRHAPLFLTRSASAMQ